MRGIQLGSNHTYNDWGLVMTSKNINPPNPKYNKISVDGRDGELNLSRIFGDIQYQNREAEFTFVALDGTPQSREALISQIMNEIHGQELQIIEPDDLDYYLVGECVISNISKDKAYASFTISANCDPYRYSINETIYAIDLTSTDTDVMLVNNGRKRLIPTITVDGTANIKLDGSSVVLSSGSYKLTSLTLSTGTTSFQVNGSGSMSISYREAIL